MRITPVLRSTHSLGSRRHSLGRRPLAYMRRNMTGTSSSASSDSLPRPGLCMVSQARKNDVSSPRVKRCGACCATRPLAGRAGICGMSHLPAAYLSMGTTPRTRAMWDCGCSVALFAHHHASSSGVSMPCDRSPA